MLSREFLRSKPVLGIIGLLVVGLGTTAFALPGINTPPPLQGRVVYVQRGTLTTTSTPSGTIVPSAEVGANFTGSGIINRVLVKPGQHVRTGQLLATLSDPTLQLTVLKDQAAIPIDLAALAKVEQGATPGALESAQANLISAEAKLAAVRAGGTHAQVLQAVAALDSARQKLIALRTPTPATVLTAQANVDSARAKLTAMERGGTAAQVEQARLTLAEAQQKLASMHATPASVAQARANLDSAKQKLASMHATPASVTQARANLDSAK